MVISCSIYYFLTILMPFYLFFINSNYTKRNKFLHNLLVYCRQHTKISASRAFIADNSLSVGPDA
ncbi:hypothetical protein EFY79_01365 [Hanamia caeni]|uniref:Uncharacterized protein n=1 Tax=Hanamia caeni TaxID=2294116 RepID=A0A3M9NQB4_9BACT|nr:hypothetical protein EFY79_01365 [Hanamia caeni]